AGVDGAEMIGIRDEAGLYNAANVEQALYEIYQAFKVFKDAVEPLNKYFFRDGSVPATGHFDLGGKQIKNLAAATEDNDAVTKKQLDYIVTASALDTSGFLLIDGSRAMTGNLQMNTKLIVNLGDANINDDYHAVNVKTLKSYIGQFATSLTFPVGCIIDVCGTLNDAKWLLCDGKTYGKEAYPELHDVLPSTLKDDYVFKVPDLRGRLTVGAGRLAIIPGSTNYYDTGKGDPYTSRNRDVGAYDGAEYHKLTIDEMPKHGHNVLHMSKVIRSDAAGTLGVSGSGPYVENEFKEEGNNIAHENMPPVFAVNKYIRAKP
ncbi:MAG: tail fiber protein, partial [Methylacidiphilales bacterium]|nr:tail fiber protein [Candidatus Methylacidiphilales bacterium]